jgi:hypothetical protein
MEYTSPLFLWSAYVVKSVITNELFMHCITYLEKISQHCNMDVTLYIQNLILDEGIGQ